MLNLSITMSTALSFLQSNRTQVTVIIRYLFDSFCFEFCAIALLFLSHGKLFIESSLYQVYLYGFFSIAQCSR